MRTAVQGQRHVTLSRKMTKSGGITIPAAVRKELGFEGKDLFTIEVDRLTGDVMLRRIKGKCILTGETDNLVEVNGRYISYAVLNEINGELTGNNLLEELIPSGIQGDRIEALLKEEEREYRKLTKANLQKGIDKIKSSEEPLTIKVRDVYDINGNKVETFKGQAKGDDDKSIAVKSPKKAMTVEPKAKSTSKKRATKAKRLIDVKSDEQLEMETVLTDKKVAAIKEVKTAMKEVATEREVTPKAPTRKGRRGIRG